MKTPTSIIAPALRQRRPYIYRESLTSEVQQAIHTSLDLPQTVEVQPSAWVITTGVSILGQCRKTVTRHARLNVTRNRNMVSSANFILDDKHVGRILTFMAVFVSYPNNPTIASTHYVAVTRVFERQYDTAARMSFCNISDGKILYLPALSVGRDILGFTAIRANGTCHGHIISDDLASARLYIIRMQTGMALNNYSNFSDYQ